MAVSRSAIIARCRERCSDPVKSCAPGPDSHPNSAPRQPSSRLAKLLSEAVPCEQCPFPPIFLQLLTEEKTKLGTRGPTPKKKAQLVRTPHSCQYERRRE